MSRRPSKKRKLPKKKGWKTAKGADLLELYEQSVQEPESEIDIIDQIWSEQRDRTGPPCFVRISAAPPQSQSSGSSAGKTNEAIGVDLDVPTLEWTKHRLEDRLDDRQLSRIELIEGDVLSTDTQEV